MRPATRLARAVLALALLVGLAATLRPAPGRPADRLLVAGRPYFLSGVNYPWKSGQEFGAGGWGYAGVATPTTSAEIDADFANLAAAGVRVVKWRVFHDGRYGPERDARGYVRGVDRELLADLDAALRLAERHDLYLVLTLFSNGFWTADCQSGPVRFGGGAATLTSPVLQRSLLRNAVVPVLRAVGQSPRVLAFEIVAEPEWGIPGLNAGDAAKGLIQVPLGPLRAFVRDVAAAIHLHTRALATVEANRASHMALWRGLGLDYYSFSWYDWLEPYEPLDRPAAAFGLDRPVVLGEFPASGSQHYSLGQVLELARRNGYAGAFAWSYWGGDGHRWQDAAQEHLDWNRANWPLVALRPADGEPAATLRLTAPPYALGEPRLDVAGGALAVDLSVQVRRGGTYLMQVVLQPLEPQDVAAAGQQTVTLRTSLPEQGRQRMIARFSELADGQVYKLSVGIFDAGWGLLKWFDQVTLVQVQAGSVQVAQLVTENPCRSRTPEP